MYTNAKCKGVQQEIMGMICCSTHRYKIEGAISMYYVDDKINVDDFVKLVSFLVYFNKDEFEVKCSYGLFEMRGIMYRNVLSVLSTKNIQIVLGVYFEMMEEEYKMKIYPY